MSQALALYGTYVTTTTDGSISRESLNDERRVLGNRKIRHPFQHDLFDVLGQRILQEKGIQRCHEVFAELPDMSNEALGELILLPSFLKVAAGEADEDDVDLMTDEGFGDSVQVAA